MAHDVSGQPNLTHLLARFLNNQAAAHAVGLAGLDVGAEVTPYEAGPVQPIDPTLAWHEALAAAGYLNPDADAGKWPPPPHWSNLVSGHEPVVALAFCVGNFPQLVRNFHLLLRDKGNRAASAASSARPLPVPALAEYAEQAVANKRYPHMLLAVGALRLAKQFDQAERFVQASDALVPDEWRAAWDNEKAALAWHHGQFDKARSLWRAMADSVPVLFNRGMAEVFVGNAAAGRAALTQATSALPETSAWHHLARLYVLLGAAN
jgi:tetratricopeptide (TPR) repeat protein